MFKTVQELQDFILWAKAEKVKRLKIGDVEVEISDYALVEDLMTIQSQTKSSTEPQKNTDPNKNQTEEDDLLMWSAR